MELDTACSTKDFLELDGRSENPYPDSGSGLWWEKLNLREIGNGKLGQKRRRRKPSI